MDIDLEFVLVLGVLVTGVIWILDKLYWEPSRRKRTEQTMLSSKKVSTSMHKHTSNAKEPWYVEYSKSFFPVLLIVLVLRSFIAEPFRIPSGSMMPTLLVGDFILVNKYAYGIRLPVLKTKIIAIGEPQRGDVAVFRYPKNPTDDYIKRVIGLPGDHIAYYNKMLYINGKPIEQKTLGQYEGVGSGEIMSGAHIKEEIIEELKHKILIDGNRLNVEGKFTVPANHYFVLGDNRDNSNDSRFWGFVPEENLVGKAFMIWLNWDIQGGVFDISRIGNQII